jgi:hypothetical protein
VHTHGPTKQSLQLLSSSKNLGRIPLSPRLALWGLKRTAFYATTATTEV